MRSILPYVALASALAVPVAAHAADIDDFTITDAGTTLTFSLAASPTVASGDFVVNNFFQIENVSVSINGGLAQTDPLLGFSNGSPTLTFFDSLAGINLIGPQVYSGLESAPTFIAGTYDVTDAATGGDATLVIKSESTPPAATPEPSTFVLLGSGLLGAFGMVRRRFVA
jgi:hypothetical protein